MLWQRSTITTRLQWTEIVNRLESGFADPASETSRPSLQCLTIGPVGAFSQSSLMTPAKPTGHFFIESRDGGSVIHLLTGPSLVSLVFSIFTGAVAGPLLLVNAVPEVQFLPAGVRGAESLLLAGAGVAIGVGIGLVQVLPCFRSRKSDGQSVRDHLIRIIDGRAINQPIR